MLKIYVTTKRNKSGEGIHSELRANLGYTDRAISYDSSLIAELLGKSVKEILTAPVGTVWEITK